MVLHSGDGGLLLFQQGVGNEVRHLKQVVVLGAAEGRASDDLLYGDVASLLAVLPEVVAAGDVVSDLEPTVEPGDHLLLTLVEDEEGVPIG